MCACIFIYNFVNDSIHILPSYVIKIFVGGGEKRHELSLAFSLLPSMYTAFITSVEPDSRKQIVSRCARFLSAVRVSETDKPESRVCGINICMGIKKLVLKLLK